MQGYRISFAARVLSVLSADIVANATGTLSPDISCNYQRSWTWNGKPSYRRLDGAYFVSYDPISDQWSVSAEFPRIDALWFKAGVDPFGVYTAVPPQTGVMTFAAGSH